MLKILSDQVLPKEVFEVKASPALLAQAVRVALANKRQGTQSALTRAEISRTRKKFGKQKGGGGARHGDRKSPIFIGGGVAFAPKPRDYSLSLSKNMRRLSIKAALTSKVKDKTLFVVSGLEDLTGKTKELAVFLKTIEGTGSMLLVTDEARKNVYQAGKNIEGVTIMPANLINTYEVLKAKRVVLMDKAVDVFEKVFSKKEAEEEKTEIVKEKKEKAVKAKKVEVKKEVKVKSKTKTKAK